ncbi:MAG: uracil-DNA glycosylase [Cyanobacteriota bacterium]
MTADNQSLSTSFVDELAALHFDNVFNPYADICPIHDTPDAACIRRRNLELVLNAAISHGIDSMWIARDLGYRGGRRTGLALTDEMHLFWYSKLLATPPLMRATEGPAVTERTATIVWRALRLIDRPIFLWNIFPLHPHEPSDPMSNRCHTQVERTACQQMNLWLIETLCPSKVIAIGRDAQTAMVKLGIKSVKIRHPSYGGQSEFLTTLAELYGVSFNLEPYQGKLF